MTWQRVHESDPFEPMLVDTAAAAEARFAWRIRRLALDAEHGAELAELIARAEAPLDLTDVSEASPDDEQLERSLEAVLRQGEIDVADAKAGRLGVAASTVAAARPLPRRRRRGRGRVVVDGVRGRALTASGQLIPGGYQALLARLAGRR
jgi:hypothetical protein